MLVFMAISNEDSMKNLNEYFNFTCDVFTL